MGHGFSYVYGRGLLADARGVSDPGPAAEIKQWARDNDTTYAVSIVRHHQPVAGVAIDERTGIYELTRLDWTGRRVESQVTFRAVGDGLLSCERLLRRVHDEEFAEIMLDQSQRHVPAPADDDWQSLLTVSA